MSQTQRLDWEKAKKRIEEANAALEYGGHTSADELDQVFQKRAQFLAQKSVRTESGEAERFLIFQIGSGRFGVPLGNVIEVMARPKIAPAPGAPSAVAGLMQVRGEVRPVWNLRVLLSLANGEQNPSDFHQVVLLRNEAHEVGILVDYVEDISDVPAAQLKQASAGSLPGSRMTGDFATVFDVKSLFEKLQDPTSL